MNNFKILFRNVNRETIDKLLYISNILFKINDDAVKCVNTSGKSIQWFKISTEEVNLTISVFGCKLNMKQLQERLNREIGLKTPGKVNFLIY